MNNSLPPDPRIANSNQSEPYARPPRDTDENEEKGFGELFSTLWEGRNWVLGSIGLFLILGLFSVWTAVPVYQADAMLQLQIVDRNLPRDPDPTKSSDPVEAQAEIEILKSNILLGRVVQSFNMDITTRPVLTPVIGKILTKNSPNAPKIVIESFDIHDSLRGRGKEFRYNITILGGGAYRWDAPDGTVLGKGKPGELLTAIYGGQNLKLKVRTLVGKPGQKFELSKITMAMAIDVLRSVYDVGEKGKLSNVLGLSYQGTDPVQCAKVLNDVLKQYIQLKIERRGGEAARRLAVLQGKMPALKAKMEEAETRLAQYQSQAGGVELGPVATGAIQQSSALSVKISELEQKKEELLRTYTPDADVVKTVDANLRMLRGQVSRIDGQAKALPHVQQEIVRLSRDVAVNQSLFTALRTTIQELEMLVDPNAVGDGPVSIVDPAMTNPEPIAPRKSMLMALFMFMGVISGTGLTLLRQALRRGVEDHRLVEAKLGIPVIVTVPHSKIQDEHNDAIRKRSEGIHLLATLNPDDLATESLRSLRTMIQLSMKTAPNHVIMVTGPSPAVGKSFISANLSAVLAQTGSRVLVVDGDLRKGTLHHYFGLKTRVGGLSEVLSGRSEWRSVIHPVRRDANSDTTEVAGLFAITSGILPPNPSELLMTNRFNKFLAEVSEVFDYVLIDSPPLLSVTDATIIGSKAGLVFLVAKYGKHPMDEFRTCQKRLDSHGIRLTGCVFNDVEQMRSGYKYAYHYEYK